MTWRVVLVGVIVFYAVTIPVLAVLVRFAPLEPDDQEWG